MKLEFSLIENDDKSHTVLVMDSVHHHALEISCTGMSATRAAEHAAKLLTELAMRLELLSGTPKPDQESTQDRINGMTEQQVYNAIATRMFVPPVEGAA